MDDDGGCEVCAMWRELANFKGDGAKRFLVVASDGFRDSLRIHQEIGSHLRTMISPSKPVTLEAPNGHVYPVEVIEELGDIVLRSGWNEFVNANHIEEDDYILFVSLVNSIFKVHIFDSSGHEKSSCSQPPFGVFGAVPPCDHHVLNEQAVPDPGHVQTSSDISYTMLPGCRLTKAQDKKVLEIADTMESEIPLHVAAMDKQNIHSKGSFVYIPLLLVLNHFKDEISKPTIQLEAPDNHIYSVGARKQSDDLVVLDSAWDSFVASQYIQEKDLLIFRSTKKNHLEVFILDPSGREKTPSNIVIGNSSSTQEMSGDSLQIVDPPPHAIFELSSSDDDDIMREGTRESCRVQKRVTRSSAKARKMASTSSPATKSGYEARKTHDGAPVKLGVGSEPPSNNLGGTYILGMKASLSLQMEKNVEEKVQAIGSELPIFVKVMGIINIDGIGSSTCEMSFCAEYASAYLPDKKHTLFLQMEGKTTLWETMLDIRSTDKLRRISRGWKQFSRENALELGDVCLFKLEDTDTSILKMTAYVIRKSLTEL
ncbi:B3 domain-containing protein Os12g0591400-like [Lolium rigidum]|uniref:B3 domain-containing protein Os12g0591400-like n=1 Tax=Lolium rigidum TaxID=89674 RepID=UPI001F5C5141|nr:B3 domain-containing protein Os12g0591400-like [Lolium rigidum]